MADHKISFPESLFPDIQLPEGAELSEHLNIKNSPILFGCRTGICGTCMAKVKKNSQGGVLIPPTEQELEVIDIVTNENKDIRLCCQVQIHCDLEIRTLK